MKPNKLFAIVIFVLLGAGLGASGWLVLNPVQPWPSIDDFDKLGHEVSVA
jgi:hypothetical protein